MILGLEGGADAERLTRAGLLSRRRLEDMLEYPWVKKAGATDVEGLKAVILAEAPDCIEKARCALRAYEETGYKDWYDWSVANWGTKWNACETRIVRRDHGRIEFTFAAKGRIRGSDVYIETVPATNQIYESVYGCPPDPED